MNDPVAWGVFFMLAAMSLCDLISTAAPWVIRIIDAVRGDKKRMGFDARNER